MNLTIKDKEINFKLGLKAINYLDNIYKTSEQGLEFGLGVQMATLQLLTFNPVAMANILLAGTCHAKFKITVNDIEEYMEKIDLDELKSDLEKELAESNFTKKQYKQVIEEIK